MTIIPIDTTRCSTGLQDILVPAEDWTNRPKKCQRYGDGEEGDQNTVGDLNERGETKKMDVEVEADSDRFGFARFKKNKRACH